MATIDHLYPKNHPLRRSTQINPYEERTVLSCVKCNNERGAIDNKKYKK